MDVWMNEWIASFRESVKEKIFWSWSGPGHDWRDSWIWYFLFLILSSLPPSILSPSIRMVWRTYDHEYDYGHGYDCRQE